MYQANCVLIALWGVGDATGEHVALMSGMSTEGRVATGEGKGEFQAYLSLSNGDVFVSVFLHNLQAHWSFQHVEELDRERGGEREMDMQ